MKTKTKTNRRKKDKQYSAVLLGLLLSGVLLFEGFLIGSTTPTEWQDSFAILDLSDEMLVLGQDLGMLAEPFMEQVSYVEDFYTLAAAEAAVMLDVSNTDPFMFARGVFDFYDQAAVEMARILDFSDNLTYIPHAAGATY